MFENHFQCLTKSEEEFLTDSFSDRIGNNRDGVSYNEFKEIVLSLNKFNKNQNLTVELLEKSKKKIKERQPGISENELLIRNLFLF